MSTPPKYVRHVPSAQEVRESIDRVLQFTDRYDAGSACDILFTACGQQLARSIAGDDAATAIARAEQSASRLVEAVVRATQQQGRAQAPAWPADAAGTH